MALCPFADRGWLIPPGGSDPRIKPRLAILHTDGGNVYNLGPYFDGPSGGIESHFHIAKNGHIFQYRDTNFEADANYRANPFAVSIETQGTGQEPWTDEQVASIIRLLLWLNAVEHIPLRKAEAWDGAGIGYHIQFGSPGYWTPSSKICPGPQRIKQIDSTIIPGLKEGDWFDMATEDTLRRIIREEVGAASIVVDPGGAGRADDKKETLNSVLRRLLNDEERIRDTVRYQAASVKNAIVAELKEGGVPTTEASAADVEAAVDRALRKVLGSLD